MSGQAALSLHPVWLYHKIHNHACLPVCIYPGAESGGACLRGRHLGRSCPQPRWPCSLLIKWISMHFGSTHLWIGPNHSLFSGAGKRRFVVWYNWEHPEIRSECQPLTRNPCYCLLKGHRQRAKTKKSPLLWYWVGISKLPPVWCNRSGVNLDSATRNNHLDKGRWNPETGQSD